MWDFLNILFFGALIVWNGLVLISAITEEGWGAGLIWGSAVMVLSSLLFLLIWAVPCNIILELNENTLVRSIENPRVVTLDAAEKAWVEVEGEAVRISYFKHLALPVKRVNIYQGNVKYLWYEITGERKEIIYSTHAEKP